VIQGSAGESAIVVILAACKKSEKDRGLPNGDRSKMVVYHADQALATLRLT